MRTTVIAIARNEGQFLIEWIAHHFAIGFDHIVIATNDCEDGSDRLLDLLSLYFPITHVDNSAPVPGLTIQQAGNKLCLAEPVARASDWLMHIDVDEFVNLLAHHNIGEFLERHPRADAIALLWKLFGDNGRRHWDGGFVTDAFWRCQAEITHGQGHKTLFRPDVFDDLTPHMPKQPRKPPEALRVVNSRGEALPVERHYASAGTAYDLDTSLLTWDQALVNHYMVKSRDLSNLKLSRGDANGRKTTKRVPGHRKYNQFNRNEAEDFSINRFRARRLAIYDQILDVPEIAAQHLHCLQWFLDWRNAQTRVAAGNAKYCAPATKLRKVPKTISAA